MNIEKCLGFRGLYIFVFLCLCDLLQAANIYHQSSRVSQVVIRGEGAVVLLSDGPVLRWLQRVCSLLPSLHLEDLSDSEAARLASVIADIHPRIVLLHALADECIREGCLGCFDSRELVPLNLEVVLIDHLALGSNAKLILTDV